ncbi:hypothetical protein DL771_001795 [Monosporascus sp. 5C6A]|nr:hypothetical protein DL771_001795 [Monosporascus sp. 5C6A]
MASQDYYNQGPPQGYPQPGYPQPAYGAPPPGQYYQPPMQYQQAPPPPPPQEQKSDNCLKACFATLGGGMRLIMTDDRVEEARKERMLDYERYRGGGRQWFWRFGGFLGSEWRGEDGRAKVSHSSYEE